MDEKKPVKGRERAFFISILTTLIVGSAVDIFVPSLPFIRTFFHTSATGTRLAIMIYLISYGVFQFVAGGLSDSIGRRKLTLISLLGYAVCSFIIVFSHSIVFFLTMRFFQGVFTAGLGVNNRAQLNDCFEGHELAKRSSYLLIGWALGPILAPYLGGYLQDLYNWKASFYFLSLFSILVFVIALFFLPETSRHFTKFNVRHWIDNYKTVFKSKKFIVGSLLCGITYGFITVYNAIGPFIVIEHLKYNAIVYGEIALVLGISWLLGILFFRYKYATSGKGVYQPFLLGSLLISIVWVLLAILGSYHLSTATTPVVLLFFCGAVIFTTAFAQSIKLFSSIAGTASAAMGGLFSIVSGITSGFASLMSASTLVPISLSYLAMVLISCVLYYCFFGRI